MLLMLLTECVPIVSAALSQVCSQNQLCNSFMAFNSNYHDTGLWGVYAVADKDAHIDDLAWAIMQVCHFLYCRNLDVSDGLVCLHFDACAGSASLEPSAMFSRH